jgi:hypothetical protein
MDPMTDDSTTEPAPDADTEAVPEAPAAPNAAYVNPGEEPAPGGAPSMTDVEKARSAPAVATSSPEDAALAIAHTGLLAGLEARVRALESHLGL